VYVRNGQQSCVQQTCCWCKNYMLHLWSHTIKLAGNWWSLFTLTLSIFFHVWHVCSLKVLQSVELGSVKSENRPNEYDGELVRNETLQHCAKHCLFKSSNRFFREKKNILDVRLIYILYKKASCKKRFKTFTQIWHTFLSSGTRHRGLWATHAWKE
jgi:hypothetical protein